MKDPSPAISGLQQKWHSLSDPDRAYAIRSIVQSGVSRRKLASALNCSPSLIRQRLDMLMASP